MSDKHPDENDADAIKNNDNNNNINNNDNNNDDNDNDDDDDVSVDSVPDFDFIESKWQDNVETGLIISWPPAAPYVLELSTKLPQDAIAPLFDGTQWAGTRVWKAAIVALEYLVAKRNEEESYNTLLELGCGLGVPGMLWYCWKQAQILKKQKENNDDEGDDSPTTTSSSSCVEVILTDQPDLLTQLEANLESNFDSTKDNISARPLSWSKEGILEILASNKNKHFDICLNCDCIYTPLYGRDSWLALGDVLETIATESPSTLLVTSVERRNGDGLEEFLERLQATGAVEEVERVLRNEEDKHHVIEIYVTKGKGKGTETLI